MRSCTRARDLFGPYWDDEVTQAEREWLESHLQSCPACHGEYDRLARALEALGALPREEAAPDLANRALAAARRAMPAPDRIFVHDTPRWVPVTAAAAVVVLAVATLLPQLMGPREGGLVARPEAPVVEPRLVGSAAPSRVQGRSDVPSANARRAGPVAAISDSLFDHSEDVDFVLDPVTLRRGRAHTVARLPQGIQGEQAVISF